MAKPDAYWVGEEKEGWAGERVSVNDPEIFIRQRS